ncbi:MAG: Uncharacterised protein [Cellulomonadaceae bacterium TMED98]|nr:MAG: Uncharacterised protein [Cellulomonadaceae bacterium TMED98]
MRRCSGEAKIGNFDPAVIGHQDVFWFQVAVHNPCLVRGVEALEDRFHHVDGLLPRQHTKVSEELAKGDSRQVFHDDERQGPVLTLVEDIHDVGVGEPRRLSGLLNKPSGELFVLGQVRVHDFHRHGSFQPVVQPAVDRGHAPSSNAVLDEVALVDGAADKRVSRRRCHCAELYWAEGASSLRRTREWTSSIPPAMPTHSPPISHTPRGRPSVALSGQRR